MLIDWFTVTAQVINFLVLAWLLKRFLYQPILTAIDAREKRIATELASAAATKSGAEALRDKYQQKNSAFDKQQSERMSQLTEEVAAERARLLEGVRAESETLRSRLQSALKNEQHNLKQALSQRTREEVFAIARKALGDLAGTTLEARITDVFIRRLETLDDEEIMQFKSAFSSSGQPLVVRTAYPLPEEQCALLETAIRTKIGESVKIGFATETDLVSGIEIRTEGQKIAWSIDDYLVALADSVDALLRSSDPVEEGADQVNRPSQAGQDTHEKGA
ncbi:F0F1 ATP synthase subunit B [uncultured Amphritea sp.]|mgnify:CR=1 FL=1|uniref:F0F1 ATP synthase subunit B family protein n=1 Tax=uncultured Amphritea sp. TaxID=981605 RepID=UPI00260F76AA|nr:F0F1 ATP synthase subunit B [uncultured Amphritea sp.]